MELKRKPDGCKADSTTQHSGNSSADFNTTTEMQRGDTNAKGTEDTETTTTTCTGPTAVCSDIYPSPSLAGPHHLGIAVSLCFILEAWCHRDGSTALTGALVARRWMIRTRSAANGWNSVANVSWT